MICELCKGKGWVQGQAPDIPTACPACGGKGFVEMTNEDWLRTLPADERVKEILSRGFMTDKRTAEEFVGWLKEKHE